MSKNHPKKCLECKKTFFAKNIRAAYCSDKCRVRANRKKSVSVTENSEIVLSKEEILLKETLVLFEQEQISLSAVQKKIDEAQAKVKEKESLKQELDFIESKLLDSRNFFSKEHGKIKSGGTISRGVPKNPGNMDTKTLVLYSIAGAMADNLMGNKLTHYDYSKEIKKCDEQLTIVRKREMAFSELLGALSVSLYSLKEESKIKSKKIEELKIKCKELEETIEKNKSSRDLNQLTDEDGFVSANEFKNINFADKIVLSGDTGVFIGALDRDRCAITLTGKPGSGKTYFSFDLISKFVELQYRVAYFSCEEGISQLTKEKIDHYKLQNAANFKIRAEANLQDIQKFASKFDVIVIDSWGKLGADAGEFDKLRVAFPTTVFIAIFQLTSSGQMRGGTKPAFDAGMNIETSIEDGKRIAVCSKNRYGKMWVKYFIDERKIEQS